MSDKVKAALEAIEKKFKGEVIMRYGDKPKTKREILSTTVPSLDAALGIGGLPKGRIIEIFGPESSGKTTLALTVAAEAQRQGGVVVYVDAEHALDPEYAQNLGVDMDNILLSQPDSGEQALEVTETAVRSGQVALVVIDSVAMLVPQSELDGDMGDANVGKQPRLIGQAVRKLTAITANTNTTVIFINQVRMNIGGYGNPEVTPGGKALKFATTVRLDIRRIGAIKQGDKDIGNRTRVKVVKNKLAPPLQQCEFDILYGKGISTEGDLLDAALEKGIIVKSGAWFKYNDVNIGQGREAVREALKDKDLYAEINDLLKETN
jgi:recombination protein RecA